MANWLIERLGPLHDREGFSCGQATLDDFLRQLANQYEKRNLGRTYVGVRQNEKRVCGYYTLASGVLPLALLPAKVVKKLPKHPVPAALLGRLAVDQSAQGQGLGRRLLKDALTRCLGLAEQIGIFAVEVLAIDDKAQAFYRKYGFVPLLDNERHMFLPMKTVADSERPAP